MAGFAGGRRSPRRVDDRLYAVPTDDAHLAAQTELQREHMETIVNRQNVGPGGI
ncbi:hypothetical protein [Gryllotalpicola protaetiae]|uniref:hypothetical protein n=1 Tax=Gryllotalpicola protaetiae TaxID=2419771 RepID=UPI0013C4DC0A|nr:hypothetical protein [Gryllotalpicola protaetiae]